MLRIAPTNWRSYEHIAAEIELLCFLHQRRISTPQPVPQKDGAYIQILHAPEGPRYAVLFTFVPGAPPGEMTEVESYRFGRAIANCTPSLMAIRQAAPISALTQQIWLTDHWPV